VTLTFDVPESNRVISGRKFSFIETVLAFHEILWQQYLNGRMDERSNGTAVKHNAFADSVG